MKRLLASCFGLGRLPLAPGTWGSLPPAIIFGLMCHFHLPSIMVLIVMAVLALAGSIACVRLTPYIIVATGKADPREVVVDEVAGQAITFLTVALLVPLNPTTGQVWAITAGGFVLFRLFDISKPCPVRRLEELPRGWGVLADDIMAGVYAGIVSQIIIFVWIWS